MCPGPCPRARLSTPRPAPQVRLRRALLGREGEAVPLPLRLRQVPALGQRPGAAPGRRRPGRPAGRPARHQLARRPAVSRRREAGAGAPGTPGLRARRLVSSCRWWCRPRLSRVPSAPRGSRPTAGPTPPCGTAKAAVTRKLLRWNSPRAAAAGLGGRRRAPPASPGQEARPAPAPCIDS